MIALGQPLPVVIAALKSLPGVECPVSTQLVFPPLPTIRVAHVGNGDPAGDGWTPLVQVECWAEDLLDASELAFVVREQWPGVRGEFAGAGYIAGAWIATEPVAAFDTATDMHRYLLTVGASVHKAGSSWP